MSLNGKVAIVTGSGVGIGRAYAHRLAADGATVLVADILEKEAEETAASIRQEGGKALAARLDQADPKSAQAMAELAVREWGGIDILVNNASLFSNLKRQPIWEITPEEWDRVMAVNLKGPFLCTMAVLASMKERGGGRVINIASSAIFGAANQLGHYVASKSGVVGLTRVMARELGQFGICVNTVAPGATDSGAATATPEYLQSKVGARSLKRVQTTGDLQGVIAFLASDDGSFITGQLLVVDGGAVFY